MQPHTGGHDVVGLIISLGILFAKIAKLHLRTEHSVETVRLVRPLRFSHVCGTSVSGTVSSVGGHIGFPGSSVYVASKFAVIGLTKTAALEFAREGVRVNSVSPGPVQTEMFDRAFGEGETEMKKTIATQTPVGRIGTPEEIASAVLWLSSPGAMFITGQDIIVDGGYTAQ